MIDLLIRCLVPRAFLTAEIRLYSGDHELWASEEHRHSMGSSIYHVTIRTTRQREDKNRPTLRGLSHQTSVRPTEEAGAWSSFLRPLTSLNLI